MKVSIGWCVLLGVFIVATVYAQQEDCCTIFHSRVRAQFKVCVRERARQQALKHRSSRQAGTRRENARRNFQCVAEKLEIAGDEQTPIDYEKFRSFVAALPCQQKKDDIYKAGDTCKAFQERGEAEKDLVKHCMVEIERICGKEKTSLKSLN